MRSSWAKSNPGACRNSCCAGPPARGAANMKRFTSLLLAAAAALVLPAAAQEISYTNSQPLTLPADTFMGQAMGVATDSKGHVFVYTRNGEPTMTLGGSRSFVHGGSSLYEFGPDGKFIRQIGRQVYGFLAAEQ